MNKYSNEFYTYVSNGAVSTAKHVFDIYHNIFNCQSVKDVGCGDGTWLTELNNFFPESNKIGYDLPNAIKIAKKENNINFKSVDFENPTIELENTELTICLEVAEHISKINAEKLINKICETSKFIIFSAAIPGQGGFNHINENPLKYWIKLFEKNNFYCFDIFRFELSKDKNIPFYYRNNIFLYTKKQDISSEIADKLMNCMIDSENNIKDYRNNVQKIRYALFSKFHYKFINLIVGIYNRIKI